MRRAVRGWILVAVAGLLLPAVASALTMRDTGLPELPSLPGTAAEAAVAAGMPAEAARTEIVLTLPEVLLELLASLPAFGGDGLGSLRPGWPQRFEIALANFLDERPFLRFIAERRGSSGSDDDPPVVPEPATALLMLFGLAGLTRAGRPRKRE
jgi:hypothetical protein